MEDNPHQSLFTDPADIDPELFSLQCLNRSFALLRHEYPPLALLVQNTLAQPRHDQSMDQRRLPECEIETYRHINLRSLGAQTTSEIVNALADIGEAAAGNPECSHQQLIQTHEVLLNWMQFAQTFLAAERGQD